MSNWRAKIEEKKSKAKGDISGQGVIKCRKTNSSIKGNQGERQPTNKEIIYLFFKNIIYSPVELSMHLCEDSQSEGYRIKLNIRLPLDESRSWFLHKWPYHQPNTHPLPNTHTRVCAHMKASRKQSTLHTHSIQVTWREPAGLEFYRLALADQMQ